MSKIKKPRFAGQGEDGASEYQSHSQVNTYHWERNRTSPILGGPAQACLFAALPVRRKPVDEWDARLWIYGNADWIERRRRIRHLIVLDHLWCIPVSVADLARRWGWREDRIPEFLSSEFSPFVTREIPTTVKQGRTARA